MHGRIYHRERAHPGSRSPYGGARRDYPTNRERGTDSDTKRNERTNGESARERARTLARRRLRRVRCARASERASVDNMNVIRLPRCQSATVASIMCSKTRGCEPFLGARRTSRTHDGNLLTIVLRGIRTRGTTLLWKSVVVRLEERLLHSTI